MVVARLLYGREEDDILPLPGWLGDGDTSLLGEDHDYKRKQGMLNKKVSSLQVVLGEQPLLESLGEVVQIQRDLDQQHHEGDDGMPADLPPWFVARDEPSAASLRLHEELLDFAAFMHPTTAEEAVARNWVYSIEAVARMLWPQCEVYIFGSRATGLCLPCAEVDVAVARVEGLRPTTALKMLAERMLQKGELSRLKLIQSASVPVLKVQQKSTGVWADIVINRVDGLEVSAFVREQMQLFPALAPLVLFLKLFLLQRKLNDASAGGIGSYILVCLVTSFLQRHPSARSARAHSTTSLGNLLLDFLRHYGQEFRYGTTGISVANGGCLFDRAARGWAGPVRTGQVTLSLESPTDSTVDVGASVVKMGVVRAAFYHGYQALGALFLERRAGHNTTGQSLLCPHLVRRGHPLVSRRYQLLEEQPPPFLEPLLVVGDANGELGAVTEDEDEQALSKRRRLNGGDASSGGEEEMVVLCPDNAEGQDPMAAVLDVLVAEAEGGEVLDVLVEEGDAEAEARAEEELQLALAQEDAEEAAAALLAIAAGDPLELEAEKSNEPKATSTREESQTEHLAAEPSVDVNVREDDNEEDDEVRDVPMTFQDDIPDRPALETVNLPLVASDEPVTTLLELVQMLEVPGAQSARSAPDPRKDTSEEPATVLEVAQMSEDVGAQSARCVLDPRKKASKKPTAALMELAQTPEDSETQPAQAKPAHGKDAGEEVATFSELAQMLEEDPDAVTVDVSVADANPDVSTEPIEQTITTDANLTDTLEAEPLHDSTADVDDIDDPDGDLAVELLRRALQQQPQQDEQQKQQQTINLELHRANAAEPQAVTASGTAEAMAAAAAAAATRFSHRQRHHDRRSATGTCPQFSAWGGQ
mmetsp:Transcript_114862/g.228603  ORF Transcript_114862/g.228603 Transcript_114862/m.228603 type:complete len:874 (+) Transcript_114862:36-2657(+)